MDLLRESAFAVAIRGKLGLSIIPDILAVPGVEVLGPLPQELQLYIVETAGVGAAVKDHTAADALLTFLKGPFAAAVFNAKGLRADKSIVQIPDYELATRG